MFHFCLFFPLWSENRRKEKRKVYQSKLRKKWLQSEVAFSNKNDFLLLLIILICLSTDDNVSVISFSSPSLLTHIHSPTFFFPFTLRHPCYGFCIVMYNYWKKQKKKLTQTRQQDEASPGWGSKGGTGLGAAQLDPGFPLSCRAAGWMIFSASCKYLKVESGINIHLSLMLGIKLDRHPQRSHQSPRGRVKLPPSQRSGSWPKEPPLPGTWPAGTAGGRRRSDCEAAGSAGWWWTSQSHAPWRSWSHWCARFGSVQH